MGRNFPAVEATPLFFGWDDNFRGIMTGTGASAPDPSTTIKKSHACRDKLHSLISHYLQDHLEETSPFIRLQWEKLSALEVPWDLRVSHAVLKSLWAGTANATPCTIWAAAFAFRDTELAAKLREEIASGDSSLPLDERSPTSKFVAEEAVRLTIFGMIMRPAIATGMVPTLGGGSLLVRKGDLVLGQMKESHRMFDDRPNDFIFDRLEKARMAGTKDVVYIAFGAGKGIVSLVLLPSCSSSE